MQNTLYPCLSKNCFINVLWIIYAVKCLKHAFGWLTQVGEPKRKSKFRSKQSHILLEGEVSLGGNLKTTTTTTKKIGYAMRTCMA